VRGKKEASPCSLCGAVTVSFELINILHKSSVTKSKVCLKALSQKSREDSERIVNWMLRFTRLLFISSIMNFKAGYGTISWKPSLLYSDRKS
jgi:hypothetical protein